MQCKWIIQTRWNPQTYAEETIGVLALQSTFVLSMSEYTTPNWSINSKHCVSESNANSTVMKQTGSVCRYLKKSTHHVKI